MNRTNRGRVALHILLAGSVVLLSGCEHSQPAHASHESAHEEHSEAPFVARHIRKQATITLNGNIEQAWPLFDPLNESKWSPAWQPEVLYPTDGSVQEGMLFRTHGMKRDRGKLIWRVTRYDQDKKRISYTVNGLQRTFSIDIRCAVKDEFQTEARVTYDFVGLAGSGNDLNERLADHLFRSDLEDWETSINHYLETGKAIQQESHSHPNDTLGDS